MAKEDNQGRVKLNPISISQLSSLIFGKGAADPEIIGEKGAPELKLGCISIPSNPDSEDCQTISSISNMTDFSPVSGR